MNILTLIIQAICGALGGNIVGKLLKKLDLGVIGNSIVGIIGGGLGGFILNKLGIPTVDIGNSPDIASILSNIGTGAAGGGVLMAIIGFIKSFILKK